MTREEMTNLATEAKELIVKLLPPDVHGECSNCERLYEIVETMGNLLENADIVTA